jgi:DNA-binding NtrC family response regulator
MILIIDDDHAVRSSLSLLLKQAGYEATTAESPDEALQRIKEKAADLFVLDMNFSVGTSGDEGLRLLREIKTLCPGKPVILITAWGSIPLAVEGMKAGAADFIAKPWTNEQLLQSVRTSLALAEANSTIHGSESVTRDELDTRYDFDNLIGRDPEFLTVLDIVGRVSTTEASVLITGESGTGKELIAEAIHRNSNRKDAPFVKVNLGGIPVTLFESEMFGHVRGAYTDAHKDRTGRFELANGGTIFLDEIGDLDLGSQVKMLRVLQDRTYETLGSSSTRTVDVRVVSATNRNVLEMVEDGNFREDLLYRLNLIALHLPPLCERTGDIPALANHFLHNAGAVYRRHHLTISDAALSLLQNLPWPGNIRELKQLVERTVLLTNTDMLDVDDFSHARQMQHRDDAKESLPGVGSMTLDEIEKAMILKCMSHHAGNISRVAHDLGISRAALYRRFEKYGLNS